MTKTIFARALPFALVLSAAPALADTTVFRFDDLDLSRPAGQAAFERRIVSAVRRACPLEVLSGTRIADTAARNACMADARKQIVDRVAAQEIANRRAG